jgi:hypothetical protein
MEYGIVRYTFRCLGAPEICRQIVKSQNSIRHENSYFSYKGLTQTRGSQGPA